LRWLEAPIRQGCEQHECSKTCPIILIRRLGALLAQVVSSREWNDLLVAQTRKRSLRRHGSLESHDGCIFLSGIGALLLARVPRLGQSAEWRSPILNDLLWFLRTSALWKDLPTCSDSFGAVVSQLHRWRQAGVFERAPQHRQAQADACRDFDCDLARVRPGTS